MSRAKPRQLSLTAEYLRSLFHYDPHTGVFTWRANRRGVRAGDTAGTVNQGRLMVSIDGVKHSASRLAWLYVTGTHPDHTIDHLDTDALNNRFANLRDVPFRVNAQNHRAARACNKSTGVLGVYVWPHIPNTFVSYITVNGKQTNLGYFKSIESASAAYLDAKRLFHEGNTL